MIGCTTIDHRALIADIEENFTLGMDIMEAHGFCLDLKQRTLGVGTEELVVHQREDICTQMVLTEDVILPEKSWLLPK